MMSIYVEEALADIDRLEEFCRRLLNKFDRQAPIFELLGDVGELETRIKDLLRTLLPTGASLGDWERKIHWSKYYVGKNDPASCRGDIAWFVDEDLASAKKQIRDWAINLVNFDAELRDKVAPLVRIRDFNSAIRTAFVVLTERLRKTYGRPPNVDGPQLVNDIFGGKSTVTTMTDNEKQPIRDYLAGAYGVLRNKYMHGDPPLNLVDLEAALATVNLALTLIVPRPPVP